VQGTGDEEEGGGATTPKKKNKTCGTVHAAGTEMQVKRTGLGDFKREKEDRRKLSDKRRSLMAVSIIKNSMYFRS